MYISYYLNVLYAYTFYITDIVGKSGNLAHTIRRHENVQVIYMDVIVDWETDNGGFTIHKCFHVNAIRLCNDSHHTL